MIYSSFKALCCVLSSHSIHSDKEKCSSVPFDSPCARLNSSVRINKYHFEEGFRTFSPFSRLRINRVISNS